MSLLSFFYLSELVSSFFHIALFVVIEDISLVIEDTVVIVVLVFYRIVSGCKCLCGDNFFLKALPGPLLRMVYDEDCGL